MYNTVSHTVMNEDINCSALISLGYAYNLLKNRLTFDYFFLCYFESAKGEAHKRQYGTP